MVKSNTGRLFSVKPRSGRSREIEEELTDPLLDVPMTIARFGRFIYAVNARFDRPDDSDDDIIRLRP
jgi:hypothetical protein